MLSDCQPHGPAGVPLPVIRRLRHHARAGRASRSLGETVSANTAGSQKSPATAWGKEKERL